MDMTVPLAPGLALLFDMDGVIVDSTEHHTRAWEVYLSRLGLASAGIRERMLGKHNGAIVRDFIGADLSAEELFRHGAEKEKVYREMMAPDLERQLVPGVRAFLEATAGAPRAVASNAEPLNISFVLERAGLAHHFQAVIDGQRVSRPKPDPEVFLRAAAALGRASGECIVFEDSPAGIAAARAARMRVVGLTTTCAALDGVDLAIPDFRDPRLEAWLCRQSPC